MTTYNYYFILSIDSNNKCKCEKRIWVAYKVRRWRYNMLHIVHEEFIDWCKELRFALSLSDVSAWNLTWFANQKCEVTHSFFFSRSTSFYSSILKYLGPSLPPVQTANDHWFFRRQHFIHCNESNLSQKWNVKSNVWPTDWPMDKAGCKLRSKPWITIQKGLTLFAVIIHDLLANFNFFTCYKNYTRLSFHHMSFHHNVGWLTGMVD